MKKVLAVAAIVGLVAAPSIASAHFLTSSDDTTASVPQTLAENTTSPTVATTTTEDNSSSTDSTVNVPGQTDPVPTSTEGDVSGATISWEDAIAQAQAVFPDKTLVKVELENEGGTVVYEFKFSDGTKFKLDAVTGAVLETKTGEKHHEKEHHDERDNDHNRRDFGHSRRHHNSHDADDDSSSSSSSTDDSSSSDA
ncbi:PepSY domain-containing protein [Candidatus Saccharibacteria bacterium]|nr:PepSY domain-containing protein [Candidatus Saccharibacteria bacterium]